MDSFKYKMISIKKTAIFDFTLLTLSNWLTELRNGFWLVVLMFDVLMQVNKRVKMLINAH